jgi:hypothetical protein
MTEKEKNIIYMLQSLYEEFSSLEEQHESDLKEFVESLHRLQHLVMIRCVRRNNQDLFPILSSKINIDNVEAINKVIAQEINKAFLGEE